MSFFFRRSVMLGCMFSVLLILSCSKDNNPINQPTGIETDVKVIDSRSGGILATILGYGMEVSPGVVPGNSEGHVASVTFSVEVPVPLPKPLPAGATQVGSGVRFGPVGFGFNWPVRILFKFEEGDDPSSLFIIRFDAGSEEWKVIPASFVDMAARQIGADVLELGEFALVKLPGFGKRAAADSQGGFEYGGETGYYYALTVKSVTFKYPAQAAWFDLVGVCAGASGSEPTGGPRRPTRAILPQGSYEIWISRTKPGTLGQLPITWTYTIPARGTINRPLKNWGLSGATDWTTIDLPGGGTWREGRPEEWPRPTNPMGTGEFQATLTWVNTLPSTADLDLHLFGPNQMHVSWITEVSDDGSLYLDRDWMDELGNATENIFSAKQMPKGNYTLKIHHFDGATKNYSVRVIRHGSVKTTTGVISDNQEHTILNFTVN